MDEEYKMGDAVLGRTCGLLPCRGKEACVPL